jgi:signal transduction histidine kinase
MSEACSGVNDFYELAAKVFVAGADYERAFYAQQRLLEDSRLKLESAGQQHREDAETMFEFELKSKEEQTRAENAARMAQFERTIRNLMIAMITIVCLSALLFYRNYTKRKIAKLTIEKQKAINADLNRMVDEKTAALFSQVEERVELQNALQQKRRNEALGELTGGVAHDFNNLLQVIMTVNELLKGSMNEKLTASDRELIESSNHSAKTGAQIIQQLLAFARQQVLLPTAINVGEFIQSQMPLLKTAAGEQFKVQISNKYPDAVMKVDTAQLTTALINLISNSRDAGSALNPTISISIRKFDVDDKTRFPELAGLKNVVIEVKDNGIGMSADELSRACNPFYTTKRHSTGTGLGLSSVHGFVKQSSGDLHISSQQDRGTKVMLAFPIARDVKLRSDSKHLPSVTLESFRVLLVEDHPQVSQAIASKLENLSVCVDVCHSGDEAIKRLQNQNYDGVLSDIRMPGKTDGIELHAWLTKNQPDTFVVLMSGFDHHDRLTESIVLLTKPFTELQLREKLQIARGQMARTDEKQAKSVKV